MTNMEQNKGEIVMYQPDETIRLEVRMEGETVWLSQAQMAELFGTKRLNSLSQPFSIPQSLKELCYWPNLNPIKHSWPFLH